MFSCVLGGLRIDRVTLKLMLLGFVAMCLQDVISTLMVVFEAHYNAPLAGLCDVAGYIVGLISSVLALDSILKNGFWNKRSLLIVAAISAANYLGTLAGVHIGAMFAH